MEHYQDITILPDPEFPPSMLMNALFTKLHRVLVQLKTNKIAVSFPCVNEDKPTLGNKLRIHGDLVELKNLQQQNWLTGMSDHVEVEDIEVVPRDIQHRRIMRVQTKSSAERLRKRYKKRHADVTEEEIRGMIPDSIEQKLSLPFLQIKSDSTGQRFRLFIKHEVLGEKAETGGFNAYGLSNKATVPWF